MSVFIQKWKLSEKQTKKVIDLITSGGKLLIEAEEHDDMDQFRKDIQSVATSIEFSHITNSSGNENLINTLTEWANVIACYQKIRYTPEVHAAYFNEMEYRRKELAPLVNLVIELDNGSLLNFHEVTIHDVLLKDAYRKLDDLKEELSSSSIPLESDPLYIRFTWLRQLSLAERAAVHLAKLNRSVENGGLSGWYQDGTYADKEIEDLIQLAQIGVEQKIEGFPLFLQWLSAVKTKYLPAIWDRRWMDDEEDVGNDSVDEKVSIELIEEELQSQYYRWDDRMECFDELLLYLKDNPDKVVN